VCKDKKIVLNRKLSKNPTILLQISSRKRYMFAKTLFESLKFEDRLITFYLFFKFLADYYQSQIFKYFRKI